MLCSKELRYCIQWELQYLKHSGPGLRTLQPSALRFQNFADPLETMHSRPPSVKHLSQTSSVLQLHVQANPSGDTVHAQAKPLQ